jgi:transposase
MPQVSTYVGLDVHKSSISLAFANAQTGTAPHFCNRLKNDLPGLLRKLRELGVPEEMKICYEAGPTGYPLCRALRAAGYDCVVIAPSQMPRTPGDKVKTDRVDSLRLAECLRNGQLKEVRVPTEQEEALRDLLRAREDIKTYETNLKRQISALMLRHGHCWSEKSTWTKAHREWIGTRTFPHQASIDARTAYVQQLQSWETELARLEQAIHEAALQLPTRDLYRAFMAVKGVKVITAATLIAEIGDFRRFETAAKFMSFLGLVPSIHASGERARRGAITKAGNGRLRRLLMEAAWAYFRAPHVSRELAKRAEGVSTEVRDIAWRAQVRLNKRMRSLVGRSKHHKTAVVAVARELAGVMWALGQVDKPVASAA